MTELWCDWSVVPRFLTLSCVCLKRISLIQGILIKLRSAVIKMYGGFILELVCCWKFPRHTHVDDLSCHLKGADEAQQNTYIYTKKLAAH